MLPSDEQRPIPPRDDGQYRIAVRAVGAGVLVARIGGDLDYVVTPRLRRRLLEPIDDTVTRLVLDLNGVTLLSAAAMDTLLGVDDICTARGCQVLVVATTRAVLRPLALLGLDHRLNVRSTVAQAIRAR